MAAWLVMLLSSQTSVNACYEPPDFILANRYGLLAAAAYS